jgi:hypothetical protein
VDPPYGLRQCRRHRQRLGLGTRFSGGIGTVVVHTISTTPEPRDPHRTQRDIEVCADLGGELWWAVPLKIAILRTSPS